ncbi:GNAT family N-acetyltransferase [Promicromonospora thailandica]|uniref:L-amino acid N-acyltransferase YncA n=1 Tax=Promicromonospora thailandica TaxID=765201 RepID=A0A9X2G7M3_9MICO|nr:GNAT family N-acetyltransferase [Promicromonospora thailandica]MCP2264056.1 L-amino acid N-acyltransferase YncA [Promicromonospora thailandica]BFF17604.1 GNAT family N-acetyltransferase [Promicromonospora thailandica]
MSRDIRPFAESDWPAVWPVIESVCRAGETYAYPTDIDEPTARAYWIEPPPGATVVLEEDRGEGPVVLGTAKMGPNRPGNGAHVGTASFMVADAARGRGVGRALGEHVIAWHREHGYRGIQFNAVVQTNAAAVHLWRSLGFQVVGTVPGAFRSPAHGYTGLHVMYLPLVD